MKNQNKNDISQQVTRVSQKNKIKYIETQIKLYSFYYHDKKAPKWTEIDLMDQSRLNWIK